MKMKDESMEVIRVEEWMLGATRLWLCLRD